MSLRKFAKKRKVTPQAISKTIRKHKKNFGSKTWVFSKPGLIGFVFREKKYYAKKMGNQFLIYKFTT